MSAIRDLLADAAGIVTIPPRYTMTLARQAQLRDEHIAQWKALGWRVVGLRWQPVVPVRARGIVTRLRYRWPA